MSVDEKRQTLRDLLSGSSSTQRGVANILSQLKMCLGILEKGDTTERSINVALFEQFDRVSTTLEMDLKDRKTFTLELCDPNLLLQELVSSSPALAKLYMRAASKFGHGPSNPWSLIIGHDEFVPGDPLAPDNRKKTLVVSFSWMELGSLALSSDDAWVTPCLIRHDILRHVIGGCSRVLRDYLKLQLFGPNGAAVSGIPLVVDDVTICIYAQLTHILADGEGHRAATEWKGASSLKPCFNHFNVWKIGSDIAHRKHGHVEASCADPKKFQAFTSEQLEEVCDLLVAAKSRWEASTMTKARLEQLQKIHGLGVSSQGLLADEELRAHVKINQTVRYDWVHAILQDGLLTVDTFLVLDAAEVPFENVADFLKDAWDFPHHLRSKGRSLH